MPLQHFRCPHCAGTFQVELSAEDQQVRCSHCSGVVTILGDPSLPKGPAAAAGGTATQARPKTAAGQPQQRTAPAAQQKAAPKPAAGEFDGLFEADGSPLKFDPPPPLPKIDQIHTPAAELSVYEILKYGRSLKVSDIHVAPGAPIMYRMARQLVPVTPYSLTSEQSERVSLELLKEHQIVQFRRDLDYDFMAIDEFGRYRVNVGHFDGEVGAVIRILAQKPKTLAELRLPPVIKKFAHMTKGLILLTGSASQGKTTTMTAILDEINTNYSRHIITMEDPIEYLHTNKKGLVRQRQAGRDTANFSAGLRAALRQNPDVISIGEMRDYETIKIALTAAETGCLVISTLHIMSIDKIIERLLSFAPAEDEGHVRYALADTLVGIIHQELVPSTDGGKRMACEILIVTQATKHIMRSRGTFMLRNVISTGKKFGMIPMSQSIQNLLDEGSITPQTAQEVMANYK